MEPRAISFDAEPSGSESPKVDPKPLVFGDTSPKHQKLTFPEPPKKADPPTPSPLPLGGIDYSTMFEYVMQQFPEVYKHNHKQIQSNIRNMSKLTDVALVTAVKQGISGAVTLSSECGTILTDVTLTKCNEIISDASSQSFWRVKKVTKQQIQDASSALQRVIHTLDDAIVRHVDEANTVQAMVASLAALGTCQSNISDAMKAAFTAQRQMCVVFLMQFEGLVQQLNTIRPSMVDRLYKLQQLSMLQPGG